MTTPREWGSLSDLLSGSTSDYLNFFFSKSVNDIKRYPHQILLLMHKIGSRGQAGNAPIQTFFVTVHRFKGSGVQGSPKSLNRPTFKANERKVTLNGEP